MIETQKFAVPDGRYGFTIVAGADGGHDVRELLFIDGTPRMGMTFAHCDAWEDALHVARALEEYKGWNK
jgi:hypothetical protein